MRCRSSAQCRSSCMSRRSGRRSTSASTAGSWPGWATTTRRLRSYPGSRRTRCSPGRSSLARQTLTTLLHSDRGTVVPVAAEPSVEMDRERLSIAAIAARSLAQAERQRRAGCALSTSSAQRSSSEARALRRGDLCRWVPPCPDRWSGLFSHNGGLSGRQRSRTTPQDPNGASNGTSREQRFPGPTVRRLPPASTGPLTNPSGSPKASPSLRARRTGSRRLATALSRSRRGHLLAGAPRSSKQRDGLAHLPRCKAPASESGGRAHCSYRPNSAAQLRAPRRSHSSRAIVRSGPEPTTPKLRRQRHHARQRRRTIPSPRSRSSAGASLCPPRWASCKQRTLTIARPVLPRSRCAAERPARITHFWFHQPADVSPPDPRRPRTSARA